MNSSRAVLRQIEPGNDVSCPVCHLEVKFSAASRCRQVICNVVEPRTFVLTPHDLTRFWDKVAVSTTFGCWPWFGDQTKASIGLFMLGGKTFYAHQLVHFFVSGDYTDDVSHACAGTICQNPAHLYHGGGPGEATVEGVPVLGKECPAGHRLDGSARYTYEDPTGRMVAGCRKCQAVARLRFFPRVSQVQTMVWDRCEQYHEACYRDIGEPFGPPNTDHVRRDRQGFSRKGGQPAPPVDDLLAL